MPLDLEPAGYGLVVRTGEPGSVVLRDGTAHVLGPGKRAAPDEPVWVPHFATCQARDHGARGRQTAVDREHERLDREAAERAQRDDDVQQVLRGPTRRKAVAGDEWGEEPPLRGPREVAIALRRIESLCGSLARDLERWERRDR